MQADIEQTLEVARCVRKSHRLDKRAVRTRRELNVVPHPALPRGKATEPLEQAHCCFEIASESGEH
jgi:hypothetical protein